ncbi:DUF2487 family protein [Sediminibacillus albus]|uniref:DUF2487 domain-containing protein n=1 Tax=Sediminibacillus albus TaxID=407036 RepID=A0A1G8VQY0_9BACI|nr:DUF2487 family protein [Sediminibacillus albus]SDJ67600.1 Protein of unknown function [Sediminibacillus albus]
MQWNKQDLGQYLTAEEYIDTLLIPLVPISLATGEDMVKGAGQMETTNIFVKEMEKQYKGRIFLLPIYSYLSSPDLEAEAVRLNKWVENACQRPFRHVFFFTFDHQWKKQERLLSGNLLWLPSIKADDIQSKETKAVVNDQVSQLTELIKSYW